jgi:hypothetical protein
VEWLAGAECGVWLWSNLGRGATRREKPAPPPRWVACPQQSCSPTAGPSSRQAGTRPCPASRFTPPPSQLNRSCCRRSRARLHGHRRQPLGQANPPPSTSTQPTFLFIIFGCWQLALLGWFWWIVGCWLVPWGLLAHRLRLLDLLLSQHLSLVERLGCLLWPCLRRSCARAGWGWGGVGVGRGFAPTDYLHRYTL